MTDIDQISSTIIQDTALETSQAVNWQDQDEALRNLWSQNLSPNIIAEKLGRSVAAVMTRAVRLGLPRRAAPGRKPGKKMPEGYSKTNKEDNVRRFKALAPSEIEDRPSQAALRVCLMCLKKFQSAGRQNRICLPCRGSSEYASASSVPDIVFAAEL